MKKRVFTLLLVFLFVISLVNGFDFTEDRLVDITGNVVKDGGFFNNVLNFFRGIFGIEPVGGGKSGLTTPSPPPHECERGDSQSCVMEELLGVCVNGIQNCNEHFDWGECEQIIFPVDEICNDNLDNDCDGLTDCEDGDCDGEVGGHISELCEYRAELTCDDGFDNDADNKIDAEDPNCGELSSFSISCNTGDLRDCFTNEVGICSDGTQTCDHGEWGACISNIQPGSQDEICNDNLDNDCDGLTDCEDFSISDCGNYIYFQGGVEKWECDPFSSTFKKEIDCDDNIDNDNDGLIDEDDEDCFECGNGIVEEELGEECDDGNQENWDGCYECLIVEDCEDGIDNNENELIDCEDDSCIGFEYIDEDVTKWDCSGGKKTEKDWDDGIDNDGDGVKDGLDSDCEGTGCNSLSITGVDISGGDTFYQYTSIDEIDCVYTLSNGDADDNSIENCLNLTVGGIHCNSPNILSTSNIAEFFNCYPGNNIGTFNAECNVLNKCKAGIVNKIIIPVNIIDFNICEGETNVGEDLISLFELKKPDDGEDIEMNETFDIEIKIKNNVGEKTTFKSKSQLIDMESMDPEVTEIGDSLELNNLATDSFEYEMTLPDDLDTDKDYRLYYKVYKSGNEGEICVSESVAIDILEAGCPDEDEDDYEDEICGGSDCDDTDDDINPSAVELCNDFVDNDCDGLTDNADPSCQSGGNGLTCNPSWSCTSWSPNPCNFGQSQTRTCTDSENCNSLTGKPIESRSCPGAGTPPTYGSDDSDSDGLPDEWEYSYFGNLAQGPNSDFDNDGYTNAQEFSMGTHPKVSDKVESSSGWLITILIALGVLIVAGIAIFIYFKFGKNKSISTQQTQPNKSLMDYVNKSRAAGLSDEEIRQKLLTAGWKKQDINKVL